MNPNEYPTGTRMVIAVLEKSLHKSTHGYWSNTTGLPAYQESDRLQEVVIGRWSLDGQYVEEMNPDEPTRSWGWYAAHRIIVKTILPAKRKKKS